MIQTPQILQSRSSAQSLKRFAEALKRALRFSEIPFSLARAHPPIPPRGGRLSAARASLERARSSARARIDRLGTPAGSRSGEARGNSTQGRQSLLRGAAEDSGPSACPMAVRFPSEICPNPPSAPGPRRCPPSWSVVDRPTKPSLGPVATRANVGNHGRNVADRPPGCGKGVAMPTDAEIRRTFAHGPAGIAQAGHREYVGGKWDEVGLLQFRFLLRHGLGPEHRLLDIGCGSLRAGQHLIPYLDRGCYMGVDKEPELIRLGVERELDPAVYDAKRPVLLALPRFEFDRLPAAPDIAWANSVFTHLPLDDIRLCLTKLRRVIAPGGVFYATFAECEKKADNPTEPHDHRLFEYTRGQMSDVGHATGWRVEHLGKWGHPRGQRMLRFTPTPPATPHTTRQGGRTHES